MSSEPYPTIPSVQPAKKYVRVFLCVRDRAIHGLSESSLTVITLNCFPTPQITREQVSGHNEDNKDGSFETVYYHTAHIYTVSTFLKS